MRFLKTLLGKKTKPKSVISKQELAARVENLKRPSIRLLACDEVSRTKFGGLPLVQSEDFVWPLSQGKPMAFLAQLDLAQIAQVHQFEWLDHCGVLLFFYDVVEMPWGYDPQDRGKWRVIYQQAPDIVADFPAELSEELQIKECFLKPVCVDVWPCLEHESVESLQLDDDEADLYIELSEPDAPAHQVGGFPDPIQGNYMKLESQLASNGVYVGNAAGFNSAEAKALEAGAVNWRLLLQFDSDDELNLMWGDCGMLYFWVEQEKAKQNNFEDCWLILQCS